MNVSLANSRRFLPLALAIAVALLASYLNGVTTSCFLGGDEGTELMKARLIVNGHRLYKDIWSDQPPLKTWCDAAILKCFVLPWTPRLVSIAAYIVILYLFSKNLFKRYGLLASTMFIVLYCSIAPTFILACSSMQEMQVIAMSSCALLLCLNDNGNAKHRNTLIGILLILAFLIKLSAIFFWAAVVIHCCFRPNFEGESKTSKMEKCLKLALVPFFAFLALWIYAGPELLYQILMPHLAKMPAMRVDAQSITSPRLEDVSANYVHFVMAGAGLWYFLKNKGRVTDAMVVLLIMELALMILTRPWWVYYWAGLAIPLCYFGAISVHALAQWVRTIDGGFKTVGALGVLVVGLYLGGRVARGVFRNVLSGLGSRTESSGLPISDLKSLGGAKVYGITDDNCDLLVWSDKLTLPLRAVMSSKRKWSGGYSSAALERQWVANRPEFLITRRLNVLTNDPVIYNHFPEYELTNINSTTWSLFVLKVPRSKTEASH